MNKSSVVAVNKARESLDKARHDLRRKWRELDAVGAGDAARKQCIEFAQSLEKGN